jgi:hypothetical protein
MRDTRRFDNHACYAQKTFPISNDLRSAVGDVHAAVESAA